MHLWCQVVNLLNPIDIWPAITNFFNDFGKYKSQFIAINKKLFIDDDKNLFLSILSIKLCRIFWGWFFYMQMIEWIISWNSFLKSWGNTERHLGSYLKFATFYGTFIALRFLKKSLYPVTRNLYKAWLNLYRLA